MHIEKERKCAARCGLMYPSADILSVSQVVRPPPIRSALTKDLDPQAIGGSIPFQPVKT